MRTILSLRPKCSDRCVSLNQARKRHININVLVRLRLGRPPVCPWDKPSLSLGQTQVVPGTNQGFLLILHSGSPVCPWDKPVANGGRKSLCAKCLCAFRGPLLEESLSKLVPTLFLDKARIFSLATLEASNRISDKLSGILCQDRRRPSARKLSLAVTTHSPLD